MEFHNKIFYAEGADLYFYILSYNAPYSKHINVECFNAYGFACDWYYGDYKLSRSFIESMIVVDEL